MMHDCMSHIVASDLLKRHKALLTPANTFRFGPPMALSSHRVQRSEDQSCEDIGESRTHGCVRQVTLRDVRTYNEADESCCVVDFVSVFPRFSSEYGSIRELLVATVYIPFIITGPVVGYNGHVVVVLYGISMSSDDPQNKLLMPRS